MVPRFREGKVPQLAKVCALLADESEIEPMKRLTVRIYPRNEIDIVRLAGLPKAYAFLVLFFAPWSLQAFDLTPSPQMITGSHAVSLCVPSRAEFLTHGRTAVPARYITDAQDGDSIDFLSARQQGSSSISGPGFNSGDAGGGNRSATSMSKNPHTADASGPPNNVNGGLFNVPRPSFSGFADKIGCSRPRPTIPIVPETNPMPIVGVVMMGAIALHALRSLRTRPLSA
jgi:hypothetical protein